jgi:hypothetical protein
MAQVKFEQPFANDAERKFSENVQVLLNNIVVPDCRKLAAPIRTLCENCGVDMVIGCGGSHVYIHRATEFVAGDHTNKNNIRWAIITD